MVEMIAKANDNEGEKIERIMVRLSKLNDAQIEQLSIQVTGLKPPSDAHTES